jgi:hypothetical protein
MWEIESPKDEERHKKYLELDRKNNQVIGKMLEGIKVKWLGAWSDRPGYHMILLMFDSMEEYSKLWSNQEFHMELHKFRRVTESFNIRMFKPTGYTIKNPPPIFS